WSDRTVVVTGGRGFLGRAVCARLRERGVGRLIAPSSAEYDLRRPDDVARLFADTQPDLVFHLAARVGGIGANMARPADLYLDNLLMGTYVIEEARKAGTPKTVVTGTICSYPKHTPVPFREDHLWQGYPEETNAPYGVAKLAQLVQAQANRAQYGQNVIYLMPTNLYGPGDKFHPAVSHVIPALIKKCVDAVESGADHIEVWGTGSASREFLYVDDAAEGLVLAAEHYDGPDPVNLGTDEELPIRDLAAMIAELTGFTGEIRWDTSKPDGQPRRRVDPSRAAELFGFKAQVPFAEGLRRTIDWYLTHREEALARADGRGPRPALPRVRRNQSTGRVSPSRRSTSGRHPSAVRASVMSGRRWAGSSAGSGSWTISELDPVTSRTSSASSRTVYSSGLPMLTGPVTSLSRRSRPPRISSFT